MKFTVLLSLFSLASAASYCPSQPATSAEQTTIFYEFVQKFYLKKDVKGAFADHFDHNYTEHNPNALSGWQDGSLEGLAGFISTTNISIIHAGFYNNTGYVHFKEERDATPPT